MHTDLKAYFTRQPEKGLLSLEACTLIYLVITTLMVLVCWDNLPQPRQMLVMRAQIIALMVLTNVVYYCYPSRITVALRALPLFALLVLWYPETYDFCRQFPYQDHIFANLDWTIFGCQPAMTFSQWLSSDFWYEAMHLGYYSYYYLMAAVIVFYFCCRYGDFQRASFVFLASFFLFYLIYDLLPVAGPQYYYNTPALSGDAWRFPIFPEVGSYFAEHTDALVLEPRGLFSRLVISAQEIGERPTAAFPSSHVGMSVVCMLLAWQARNRWLFWLLMPFFLLLVFSTVYIRAHYAVDAFAGLIAGVAFFWLTQKAYPLAKRWCWLKD